MTLRFSISEPQEAGGPIQFMCNDQIVGTAHAGEHPKESIELMRGMVYAIASLSGGTVAIKQPLPTALASKVMPEYRVLKYAIKNEGFTPTETLHEHSGEAQIMRIYAEYEKVLIAERQAHQDSQDA